MLLDGCGRDCPGPCRGTRQRSGQGSKTAAGRQHASRAQALTARTAWHDEGHSKPAHPLPPTRTGQHDAKRGAEKHARGGRQDARRASEKAQQELPASRTAGQERRGLRLPVRSAAQAQPAVGMIGLHGVAVWRWWREGRRSSLTWKRSWPESAGLQIDRFGGEGPDAEQPRRWCKSASAPERRRRPQHRGGRRRRCASAAAGDDAKQGRASPRCALSMRAATAQRSGVRPSRCEASRR